METVLFNIKNTTWSQRCYDALHFIKRNLGVWTLIPNDIIIPIKKLDLRVLSILFVISFLFTLAIDQARKMLVTRNEDQIVVIQVDCAANKTVIDSFYLCTQAASSSFVQKILLEILHSEELALEIESNTSLLRQMFSNEWDDVFQKFSEPTSDKDMAIYIKQLFRELILGQPSYQYQAPDTQRIRSYIQKNIKISPYKRTRTMIIRTQKSSFSSQLLTEVILNINKFVKEADIRVLRRYESSRLTTGQVSEGYMDRVQLHKFRYVLDSSPYFRIKFIGIDNDNIENREWKITDTDNFLNFLSNFLLIFFIYFFIKQI